MKLEVLKKEVAVGVLGAIVITGIGPIWHWSSGGEMIHALGGVTQADLEIIARRISVADVPAGAVIAFHRPNGCPEGWELEDDVVGSAIVGIGATSIYATGDPIIGTDMGGRWFDDGQQPEPTGHPHMRGHHPPTYLRGKMNDPVPKSEYVYGV